MTLQRGRISVRFLWIFAGIVLAVVAALYFTSGQESEASIVGQFDYPDIPAYPLGAALPDVSTSPAISPYFVAWSTADSVAEAATTYRATLSQAGWTVNDPVSFESGTQFEAVNTTDHLTAVVSELQPGSTSVMLTVYSK